MGAGLSEEDNAGQERAPCNERYLHWLLSDPSRVQEAFKPVWRACCTDEQGTAPKTAVLEVMLRVVAEFERGAETGGKAGAAGKTPRQLSRVVELLPEKLARTEAQHLFRTALLSVQASLVTMLGQDSILEWPPSPFSGSPGAESLGGALPSGGGEGGGGRSQASPEGPFGGLGAPGHAAGTAAEPVPSSRPSTRAEDHTPKLRVMRLHPAVKAAPLSTPGLLPSREELDVENNLLQSLSEVVEASTREELMAVRSFEEELRANEASGELRRRAGQGGRNDSLFMALEAKSETTEEEVRQLELKVKAGDRELTECEAEVLGQQREIQALLARRGEEEASADELSREARDLTLELKSCRRTCGSLESEIASEEARAAALRQAFEGRRARFTTAETAARNAELSTMRATRRRIAAEAAARREASAVEEAENARQSAASSSEMQVEALMAEIEELKLQVPRSQAAPPGRRPPLTAQAAAAVATLRSELQAAEAERDGEVASAHNSANEVAELEVARARLEGQLAGRESELHAVQRRALRSGAASSGAEPSSGEDEEREVRHVLASLQALELRAAGAKQRELEMCSELRALPTARRCEAVSAEGGDLTEEELLVDAAWRRAREVGAELGEAHAALQRRRAQDQSTGGNDVVAALHMALRDAEQREARRCAELAEVCDRLTASLAEEQRLQRRVVEAFGNGGGGALAGRASRPSASRRLEVLEAKSAALEEEHHIRSRALITAEAQTAEARIQAVAQRSTAGFERIGGSTPGPASPEPRSLLRQVQALERQLGQRESQLLDRKLDSLSLLRRGPHDVGAGGLGPSLAGGGLAP